MRSYNRDCCRIVCSAATAEMFMITMLKLPDLRAHVPHFQIDRLRRAAHVNNKLARLSQPGTILNRIGKYVHERNLVRRFEGTDFHGKQCMARRSLRGGQNDELFRRGGKNKCRLSSKLD